MEKKFQKEKKGSLCVCLIQVRERRVILGGKNGVELCVPQWSTWAKFCWEKRGHMETIEWGEEDIFCFFFFNLKKLKTRILTI